MTDRELFVVTLRPEPGVAGLLAVRALLKLALRSFGLKCISVKIALGDEAALLEQSSEGSVAKSSRAHAHNVGNNGGRSK